MTPTTFTKTALLATSSLLLLALVPPAGAGASLGVVCVGDPAINAGGCSQAVVTDTLTACSPTGCDYDYEVTISVAPQTCVAMTATIDYVSDTWNKRYFQECNEGYAQADYTWTWTEVGTGDMVDLTLSAHVLYEPTPTVSTAWTHYATPSGAENAEAWAWRSGEFWARAGTADLGAPVGVGL